MSVTGVLWQALNKVGSKSWKVDWYSWAVFVPIKNYGDFSGQCCPAFMCLVLTWLPLPLKATEVTSPVTFALFNSLKLGAPRTTPMVPSPPPIRRSPEGSNWRDVTPRLNFSFWGPKCLSSLVLMLTFCYEAQNYA